MEPATLARPRVQQLADLAPTVIPNATFAPLRRCTCKGCITYLCSFNPGPRCFLHEAQRRGLDTIEEAA